MTKDCRSAWYVFYDLAWWKLHFFVERKEVKTHSAKTSLPTIKLSGWKMWGENWIFGTGKYAPPSFKGIVSQERELSEVHMESCAKLTAFWTAREVLERRKGESGDWGSVCTFLSAQFMYFSSLETRKKYGWDRKHFSIRLKTVLHSLD